MKFFRLIVAALVCAAAHAAFAAEPFAPGGPITGELKVIKTRHPNGTRIIAFQITSTSKKALTDEFCVTRDGAETFHLLIKNGDKETERRLWALRNKTVTVFADEFSCSQTAWHIGDAVVFKWRFAD